MSNSKALFILIGPKGSGKTHIGKLVSQHTDIVFLRVEMPGIGDYGAALRFYNPDIDAWRSTWIGPARHFVFPFIGHFLDGEITLEGNFGGEIAFESVFMEGICTRWIFSDITADSFSWRALQSNDAWATHLLYQEMVARRAANIYSE